MDVPFLESILQNEGKIPEGHTLEGLTPTLLEQLGSTDEALRENSLSVVWEWIERGFYSPAAMRQIASQTAGALNVGLGSNGDDRVFQRAFSALILEAVILQDERYAAGLVEGQEPFLCAEDVRAWLEPALAHLSQEQDLRGYVAGKGWAHALAHNADLLCALARSRHLTAADLQRLLLALAQKITAPAGQVLQYREEERMARVVVAAALRDPLDLNFYQQWLDTLCQPPNQPAWASTYSDEALNHAFCNTLSFLRSLYFLLLFGVKNFEQLPYYERQPQLRTELLSAIETALRKLGRFYRPAAG